MRDTRGAPVFRSSGWVLGLLLVCAACEQPSAQPVPDSSEQIPSASAAPTRKGRTTAKPSAPPRPKVQSASSRVRRAKAALADLEVKGRAPLTGYDRDAFGAAWSDTDANGCDTRNDVLRRDLRDTDVVACVVMSGTLDDPYSGDVVPFQRGPVTSLDVQVDHVVALANAWQTGAKFWDDAKRLRFANDRRALLAVRGDLNLSKGDGDAATWLPPRKSFRCEYVAIQVLTKQRYRLWTTPAERAAMQRVLGAC